MSAFEVFALLNNQGILTAKQRSDVEELAEQILGQTEAAARGGAIPTMNNIQELAQFAWRMARHGIREGDPRHILDEVLEVLEETPTQEREEKLRELIQKALRSCGDHNEAIQERAFRLEQALRGLLKNFMSPIEIEEAMGKLGADEFELGLHQTWNQRIRRRGPL